MNIRVNENYRNIKESYLFSEIGKRVSEYSAREPEKAASIVRLGIGDVTLPLAPVVVEAMKTAAAEMGCAETFRGYPPEYGYGFLRDAVSEYYSGFGVNLCVEDIFISDGAKSDIGNLVDILADNKVYIPDPVYPVYVDSNIMSARSISYIAGTRENGFLPMPEHGTHGTGVYYLCSPNNPTGAVYSREHLSVWVNFALNTGSLIIFDSAYDAFMRRRVPSFHIRNSRRGPVRHRGMLFFQNGRFYRYALRLDRGSIRVGVGGHEPEQNVATPSGNQVQRRVIPGTVRRQSRSFKGGPGTVQKKHRVLYGKCRRLKLPA